MKISLALVECRTKVEVPGNIIPLRIVFGLNFNRKYFSTKKKKKRKRIAWAKLNNLEGF